MTPIPAARLPSLRSNAAVKIAAATSMDSDLTDEFGPDSPPPVIPSPDLEISTPGSVVSTSLESAGSSSEAVFDSDVLQRGLANSIDAVKKEKEKRMDLKLAFESKIHTASMLWLTALVVSTFNLMLILMFVHGGSEEAQDYAGLFPT